MINIANCNDYYMYDWYIPWFGDGVDMVGVYECKRAENEAMWCENGNYVVCND